MRKVFALKHISLAALLGGPLAAGFLMAVNFRAFDKSAAARNSIFLGILSTMAIVGGLYAIPEALLDRLPTFVLPVLWAAIIAPIAKKTQEADIDRHFQAEGPAASGWSLAGYILLGGVVVLGLSLGLILSSSHEGYEEKVEVSPGVELHYEEEIPEEEAGKIARALQMTRLLEGAEKMDLFLEDRGKDFMLRFVLGNPGMIHDSVVIHDFNLLESMVNVYGKLSKRLEVGFYDLKMENSYLLMKPQNPFHIDQWIPREYQYHEVTDYHRIHFNSAMPMEDVQHLAESVEKLTATFPAEETVDLVFENRGGQYFLKFFVDRELWGDNWTRKRSKDVVGYIRLHGIDRAINVVFMDGPSGEEMNISAMELEKITF